MSAVTISAEQAKKIYDLIEDLGRHGADDDPEELRELEKRARAVGLVETADALKNAYDAYHQYEDLLFGLIKNLQE